jgi:serine protease DegQ
MLPAQAPATGDATGDATAAAETRATGRLHRPVRLVRRAGPFLMGIAAAFIGLWLFTIVSPSNPITTSDVDREVQNALASQTPPPPDSELVYQQIAPSLVLIQADFGTPADVPNAVEQEPGAQLAASEAPVAPGPSTAAETPAAAESPGPLETPNASGAPQSRNGLGSGTVVSDRGDILTSLHVVDQATSITVTYATGETVKAQIIGRKPEDDIALLLPIGGAPDAPPATLGDPHRLHIGSEAFVVGNPFGLYGSMSAGVVSGLDRAFQVPDTATVLHGLIQVDAAVNPGNSGGPLLDRDGLVVGVVAALVNPTPDHVFAGIGLAVPIDVAASGVGVPPD